MREHAKSHAITEWLTNLYPFLFKFIRIRKQYNTDEIRNFFRVVVVYLLLNINFQQQLTNFFENINAQKAAVKQARCHELIGFSFWYNNNSGNEEEKINK